MKRCPQCGREYDSSMKFCLDDGAELLYGPASGSGSIDEPQTAILSGADAPTRQQVLTTDQTVVLSGGTEAESRRSFDNRSAKPLMAIALTTAVLIGGFFGYRYFGTANSEQIESIAVMPFVNESGNSEVEYLSDGMTETLIKSLSELPNLNVKPRSSVFRYKGKDTDVQTIGKELNVEAILNGRVVQRGELLTLSLELVDVQNDKVLWTEQYQRKQSDLISLQSEIAKDVSTKLKLKLSGADEAKVAKTATASPEAYQAYLKGRFYWNRRTAENLQKATEQFKTAIDLDPNYAPAYAGLADCYALSSEYAGVPSSETVPQTITFAKRALEIDPSLAEPHTTLGFVNAQSWKWTEAESEFERAIELNPNYATAYHWYGIFLKGLGRNDEAAAMIKRASELDPVSNAIAANVSMIYQLQNNHEASVENSLKLIELDPSYSRGYEYLALSYLKLGRKTEAITAAEKAVSLSNRQNVILGETGNIYALSGEREKATAIIRELEGRYADKKAAGHEIAAVYAGLGEKDKAFEWLERDFQVRDGRLYNIRWEIAFEPLHDDPRLRDLLKRMGLPE